jgi:hypothetical protein
MTLMSSRSHSASPLSGSPVFDPFRFLKNATRFIISSRVQLRIAGSMAASPCGFVVALDQLMTVRVHVLVSIGC